LPDLFDPLTLRGVTLRNRIGLAPMCQYCCGPDGRPTDWHLAHLLQRAIGGAGLVLTEATAVTAEGRITPADLGLWEEAQVAGHARLVSAIAAAGAVPGIQLAHAGRKASRNPPWIHGAAQPGWEAIGPSALAMDGMVAPRAMAESEIADTITAFVAAARRAVRVGYRVVELHAAHGYLLHQFLSPLSNARTDSWGGDFEGRTRLVRETAAAMRDALPADIALFLRISHTDWAEGGWTTAESVELASRVAPLGVDLIDVSSGGIANRQVIPLGPGYQVPGAEAVRGAGVPVAAVGLIEAPGQAQEIVTEGKADMILLARAMLRDPYWPIRAAQALGRTDRLAIPPQYERGWGNLPMRQETAEPMPAI
jgi:2,4-dienoyl-CoA reductase-like NADH-dependent reductase (Old Yellow Enzyme family)